MSFFSLPVTQMCILDGDSSPPTLSGGAQGFFEAAVLSRDKDITEFQFSLNRHLITAGPPFWPKSISLSQMLFECVRVEIGWLFSCWKHPNFKVIYVALAPDWDFFVFLEFANELFKSNKLLQIHRVDPREGRPEPSGLTEEGQLVALFSRLLQLVLHPVLRGGQLIPTCICLVILSTEVRHLDEANMCVWPPLSSSPLGPEDQYLCLLWASDDKITSAITSHNPSSVK